MIDREQRVLYCKSGCIIEKEGHHVQRTTKKQCEMLTPCEIDSLH